MVASGGPDRFVSRVEEFLEEMDDIEEGLDSKAQEKARGFFESVRTKLTDMSDTVRRMGIVTEKQKQAFHNQRDGVRAWRRDR